MRKNKTLIIFMVILHFLTVVSLGYAEASLPNPSNEFYIYDETNLISKETKDYIVDINKKLENSTGSQVVVAIIDSLNNIEIEDYAVQLFRHWGIGDKDKNNGVLFLIAKEEREVRIETGYGLEGALPDGKTGNVLDKYVVPSLRKDDYDTGIRNGFSALVDIICKEYEINIDELQVVEPKSDINSIFILLVVFLIIVIIIVISDSTTGGHGGGYRGGSFRGSSFRSTSSRSGGSFKGGGGFSGGGGASRGF